MSTNTELGKAMKDVVEDARILMEATATVAGDNVAKARKRLAAALKRGEADGEAGTDGTAGLFHETVGEVQRLFASAVDRSKEKVVEVRDQVVEKAQSADRILHNHPYKVMGIALGVGALVGLLASLRFCHKRS
ncbi:MAG: DUF883 C-terminal domain-containing protein [Kiritimatiellia bacterium]|nr:DUF883 C-terminal domain-containing protein [Kiritimatiellia bacterium]